MTYYNSLTTYIEYRLYKDYITKATDWPKLNLQLLVDIELF